MHDRLMKDIGERGWLEILFGHLKQVPEGQRNRVGIGDDAAVLKLPGSSECLIITTDAVVENTHFLRSHLASKWFADRILLAAASDVTAMGGIPHSFLLTLGCPADLPVATLDRLAERFADLSQIHKMSFLGGDTVSSDRLFFDLVVLGSVADDQVLVQSGGCEGDAIWVSGYLGAARTTWAEAPATTPELDHELIEPELSIPPVRWPLLPCLRQTLSIRAMTDISDGLALDLKKILAHSNHGAEIQMETIPVAAQAHEFALQRGLSPAEFAWLGGEDFELLVVEKGNQQKQDILDLDGIPLTRIGVIGGSILRLTMNGQAFAPTMQPFEHFPDNRK